MERLTDITLASLVGTTVALVPMAEHHFEELVSVASEKRIWEHIPVDMGTPQRQVYEFSRALSERSRGNQLPYVIYSLVEKRLIGSTRIMDIVPESNKVEIGWTWMHPEYWSTHVNNECKLMLLTYAFEELKVARVQFRTDENNLRSRRAIEKIGAKLEGIHRKDWIRHNGTTRNTVFFSILDSEWNDVKPLLTERLSESLYRHGVRPASPLGVWQEGAHL